MSINLNLEINEVEAIVAGLRKLPMELVEETVLKIKIQAIPQIQNEPVAAKSEENFSSAKDPINV